MSTPLIALAAILAVFAIVLIPFMFVKSGQQQPHEQHAHADQGKKVRKKKKKR